MFFKHVEMYVRAEVNFLVRWNILPVYCKTWTNVNRALLGLPVVFVTRLISIIRRDSFLNDMFTENVKCTFRVACESEAVLWAWEKVLWIIQWVLPGTRRIVVDNSTAIVMQYSWLGTEVQHRKFGSY